MVYEFPHDWIAAGRPMSLPKGWYRLSSGSLRYWNGRQWTGSQAWEHTAPKEKVDALTVWSVALVTLAWLVLIIAMGALLSAGP